MGLSDHLISDSDTSGLDMSESQIHWNSNVRNSDTSKFQYLGVSIMLEFQYIRIYDTLEF